MQRAGDSSRLHRAASLLARRGLAGVALLFLGWLAANLLLCEFQVGCAAPLGLLPRLGQGLIANYGLLVFGLAATAAFTVVGLALETYWRLRPPRTSWPRRIFRLARAVVHVPLWVGVFVAVSVGFLGARALFFQLLLLLSLPGVASWGVRRAGLGPWPRRLVVLAALAVAGVLLSTVLWAPRFVSYVPRSALLAVLLAAALAGAGLRWLLAPHPSGLAWYVHQARCAGVLLACAAVCLGQLTWESGDVQLTQVPGSAGSLLLRAVRSYDIVSCTDPRFVYVSFDRHGSLVRLSLDPERDGPPLRLDVGEELGRWNHGVPRPVCDRERGRLLVPVLVYAGPSHILEVDEAAFSVVSDVALPDGTGKRVFDITLDRAGRQVLAVTKDGHLYRYAFGDSRPTFLADLAPWFEVPQHDHIIHRITVNEERRVLYVCPWPLAGTRMVELDLDTGRVERVKEFDDNPTDLRVLDGGERFVVALPFRQEVQVLDAASLDVLARYPIGFSARDMAVAESADRLIVGNFLTGTVNLLRLSDGRNLANWYLGPGLRGVELDAAGKQAFGATIYGVHAISLP